MLVFARLRDPGGVVGEWIGDGGFGVVCGCAEGAHIITSQYVAHVLIFAR
jgi:hypothetical protein